MKRMTSVVVLVIVLLANVGSALASVHDDESMVSTSYQSSIMTDTEMHHVRGGIPVLNIAACTALLLGCLDKTEGWWADLSCIGLTGLCLSL